MGSLRARFGQTAAVLLLAVGVAGLAACGGGGSKATSTTTSGATTTTPTTGRTTPKAATVTAARYVSSVCSTLGTWRRQLLKSRQLVRTSVAASASPAAIRQSIIGFLDGAITLTEDAALRLHGAGVPAVANGSAVADELMRTINGAKSVFVSLRGQTQRLPVADRARFNRGLVAISSSLRVRFANLSRSFQGLATARSSAALRKAAESSPACRSL